MENTDFNTADTLETEEKRYTQKEVDSIVKGRLARERSKAKSEEKPSEEDIEKMICEDREWFSQNVGGDFEEFLQSDDFKEFMEDNPISIRKGMEKFIKLKGASSFAKRENAPVSTGSVRDGGDSSLKDYYSPKDVDKLSDSDYKNPEIMKRVRKSMTKWK